MMTCCQAQSLAESGEISFYQGKDTTVPVYKYIYQNKPNHNATMQDRCNDQPKYPNLESHC